MSTASSRNNRKGATAKKQLPTASYGAKTLPTHKATETDSDEVERVVFLKDTADVEAKWRSWWIRVISSLVMGFGFIGLIFLGHFYLIVLLMLIIWRCFHEIKSIGWDTKMKSLNPLSPISLARAISKPSAIPAAIESSKINYNIHFYFKNILRYIIIVGLYFLFAPIFITVLTHHYKDSMLFKNLLQFHNFISFSFYIFGFVLFVLSLRRGSLVQQFSLFGFVHVLICFLGSQGTLIVSNIMEGLIWFLLPAFIVIINDCTAYIFGFFFGATRLIDLSPKKTWEGFIGAFISTLVLGTCLGYFFSLFPSLTCPISELRVYPFLHSRVCDLTTIPDIYTWKTLDLEHSPIGLLLPTAITALKVQYIPILFHSFIFSLFGSTVAPFGGFFASGFKRAFGVKDFSNTLPGHGGFMDRFDCQLIMGTFVYVYYTSFIKQRVSHSDYTLLKESLRNLDYTKKLEIYQLIKELI